MILLLIPSLGREGGREEGGSGGVGVLLSLPPLVPERKLVASAGQGCNSGYSVELQLFSASTTSEILGRSKGG